MGLIKAAFGAAGGVLADQWKEFFYCEAIPADVLAVKGRKKVTGRSSNTKGDDNIITNGSVIAVADGQCMLIVEQGKVVDVCAEPGEYTYDTSTEPSIFSGDLGESIKSVFQNVGKRFTFGGEAPKDQRVYYFNTKELTGNKYGTPSPVPFRVVDQRAGIDLDIAIRCFGEYSVRLKNPLLFYTNSIDFRLVHTRDIGLFQYNHENRVWEVIVAGHPTPIKLRRNVNNETLLTIDDRFVQVSQKYVININYLIEVNDNVCRFYPPFDKIDYVKVGRLFRRKLTERFCSL